MGSVAHKFRYSIFPGGGGGTLEIEGGGGGTLEILGYEKKPENNIIRWKKMGGGGGG